MKFGINVDQSAEEFKEVLRKKLPTQEEKMSMILTLLGCAGHLTEFIGMNCNMEKLPIEVKYS
ncbi:hypothetical protein LRR18_17540, partial [Mangrovimonas sp. AS39]|uniref:hypothetical protein n=1 Tax=Mangrovimonas futianensis TaxID=2895523 RepID=UPI001E58B6B6